VCTQLDAGAYEEAWSAGRALSLQAAITEALQVAALVREARDVLQPDHRGPDPSRSAIDSA
jgi:hypothetical protein